ncbi:MAG: 30S ribosomal protein S20 [Clostridia bacterium]|nr:30S ribosomal protein S20 [Clostridia bacterium]
MANIKSQKKRIEIAKAENLQNKSKKSRIATEVRNFRGMIKDAKLDEAQKALNNLFSLIDRARLDGVYKINTASRKKAALARELSNAKTAK